MPLKKPRFAAALGEPYLLMPGPLTTAYSVKQAMLRDWGSWDDDFRATTAELRRRLVALTGDTEGAFDIPRDGKVPILARQVICAAAPAGAGNVAAGVRAAFREPAAPGNVTKLARCCLRTCRPPAGSRPLADFHAIARTSRRTAAAQSCHGAVTICR